ncbi:MAG TPA: cupin domain-containing protein [Lacibacter sp.]|nr:cupin domain-containing protein [Lacibacter sp.]HMO89281.1 cupin domain-containing protein [Lacibacter sp.]HMP85770.1 cupin domain-containing protein [Lacibacter sp.]
MYIGNIADYLRYDKINKAAVFQDDRLQIMMLNLPAGAVMKEYSSNKDAYFVVQKGRVEFILENDLFLLKEGDVFHLRAGQLHSLQAITDFSMLIFK